MLDHRQKNPEVDCQDCQTGLMKLADDVPADVIPPDDSSKPSPTKDADLSSSTTIEESSPRTGRWTPDEKILFLYGLKRFGKGRWKKMSIYLPHRSLVQIKSHAQKVLKRQDAGENIFRRLEENCREIDTLVDRASCQRDALGAGIKFNTTTPPKSFSTAAKRKRQANRSQPVDRKDEKSGTIRQSTDVPVVLDMEAEGEVESGQAVIAAAALCQLSSLAAPWDQQGVINPITSTTYEQLSEL